VDYQQAPEEASLQAQVADYQLVLVAGYQQAQVADYQLVLVAGYQQAQVVDFLPGRVEVSQLAPAVDYQQVLATIGAVCLALIMAGKIVTDPKINSKNRRTRRLRGTARSAVENPYVFACYRFYGICIAFLAAPQLNVIFLWGTDS
jgi:hypothetical protein